MKTRSCKTKYFKWKLTLITHSIICYYRNPKRAFCGAKFISDLKLPTVLIDRFLFSFHSDRVLFKFISNRVLFRFISNRVLFRFISNRVLFDSTVIFKGSSSGSSLIDSSLASSVPFFWYVTMFLSKCVTTFLLKADVLFLVFLCIFKKTFTLSN